MFRKPVIILISERREVGELNFDCQPESQTLDRKKASRYRPKSVQLVSNIGQLPINYALLKLKLEETEVRREPI